MFCAHDQAWYRSLVKLYMDELVQYIYIYTCTRKKAQWIALVCLVTQTLALRTGMYWNIVHVSGADPGFHVKRSALKIIAQSGVRRENFWGILCEKSRFYAKKNHIFSNFRGSPGAPPPPESAPAFVNLKIDNCCPHALDYLVNSKSTWLNISILKGY